MKLYIAWSQASEFRTDHDWENLLRATILSALVNTSLKVNLLYDGLDTPFTAELQQIGVKIIKHRVSIYEKLREFKAGDMGYLAIAAGAFLRFDIPIIEDEDEFVLYTDSDVMFMRDVDLSNLRPENFAAAPQFSKTEATDMNSGVMLINVNNMRKMHDKLIKFATDNLQLGLDQEILREFFGTNYTLLPAEFNWKPYWGIAADAYIVHWHGPKPVTVSAALLNSEHAMPPIWRELLERDRSSYDFYNTIYNQILQKYSSTVKTRSIKNIIVDQNTSEDDGSYKYITTRMVESFYEFSIISSEPNLSIYFYHLNKLNEIIVNSNSRFEGGICYLDGTSVFDRTPNVDFLFRRLNFAMFSAATASLLEVGFNAGHSALLALCANRELRYVGVDIGHHAYTKPCFEYLRTAFGNRIELHIGDSREILPRMRQSWSFGAYAIDGGHGYDCALSDLINVCRLGPTGALVLVDNIAYGPIRAAVALVTLRKMMRPVDASCFFHPADHALLEIC